MAPLACARAGSLSFAPNEPPCPKPQLEIARLRGSQAIADLGWLGGKEPKPRKRRPKN